MMVKEVEARMDDESEDVEIMTLGFGLGMGIVKSIYFLVDDAMPSLQDYKGSRVQSQAKPASHLQRGTSFGQGRGGLMLKLRPAGR
ncbi:hypothetical protein HYALB_00006305 [Hymenoscyphus albidus]|uniref:Uncharacterized protein n=1 Tax=Hymenoscyphus albidus TaxID=595503 RepID=A0A9N9M607_9HELO|nr:hypothetical protein HYALB_00006305 [Hymenoscyphus albidus]